MDESDSEEDEQEPQACQHEGAAPSVQELLAKIRPNPNAPLTPEMVQRLKDEGCDGKEIIRLLVEQKEGFDSKTVFAQKKWLRRLEARHLARLCVFKITPDDLCRFYLATGSITGTGKPQSVGTKDKGWETGLGGGAGDLIRDFRPDMMDELLLRASINANSTHALVHDEVGGLLASAAAWRMGGGRGLGGLTVVSDKTLIVSGAEKMTVLKMAFARCNLMAMYHNEKELADAAALPPVESHGPAKGDAHEDDVDGKPGIAVRRSVPFTMSVGLPRLAHTTPEELGQYVVFRARGPGGHDTANALAARRLLHIPGREEPERVEERIRNREFVSPLPADSDVIWLADSFACATRNRVLPLLLCIMPFLRPGARFAVWSPYLHAQTEARDAFRRFACATDVQLTETRLTPMVVRTGASHPAMSFGAADGYILSGIATGVAVKAAVEELTSVTVGEQLYADYYKAPGGDGESDEDGESLNEAGDARPPTDAE